MIIHRNNGSANRSTPEERLAVMQRHHQQSKLPMAGRTVGSAAPPAPAGAPPAKPPTLRTAGSGTMPASPGDLVYGARAITGYVFEDLSDTARRRVFNLYAYYKARGEAEAAGFRKLKGGLCLSKSKWSTFHGL